MKFNNIAIIELAAAVMVVYSHAFPLSGGGGYNVIGKESLGGIAVSIFMFLSGYLCMKSLRGSSERLRSGCVFMVKRLSRLVIPLTFAVLFAAFVIGPLLTTLSLSDYLRHPGLRDYLMTCIPFAAIRYNLPGVFETNAFPSVNGSLWMITALWWSYAFMAVATCLGVVRNRRVVLSLCIFLWGVWLARSWLNPVIATPVWHIMSFSMNDSPRILATFLTGWTFALFDENYEYSGWLSLVFCALLYLWLHTDVCDLALAVLGGYVLAWAAHARQIPHLDRLPPISFGIYLIAFPIQETWTYLFGGRMNPYLNFALSMATIVPLALLEYHFVERPTFRLRTALLAKIDALFARLKRIAPSPAA